MPPELIDNTEIGLRSDWLDGKLRFNATYFDSDWDGMRVALLPTDAAGNTQPFPYNSGEGAGTASGLEFEVVWAPTDRLNLNYGLGLIDTEYIQAGVLTGPPGQASITGNYPGAPFAYARRAERLDRRAVRDPDAERRALLARRQLRLRGTTTRATPPISARSSTRTATPSSSRPTAS